ncbi:MAG: glutamate-cysteine ligase family protein [Patescibacteria group bacterium]
MNNRLIGLEYEFLGVQKENGHAVTRDIMKAIWRDWSKQKNVELYIDYGTKQPVGVIYKQKDGGEVIVNTDAGICIVEFGFLPFATLQKCESNMREILQDFFVVAKKHGVGLMSYGIQPKTPHFFPDLKSEKMWYRGFARLPHFSEGHPMFHTISAHQPCVDVSYEELIPVLNILNAIGGVTIALFANSGVGEYQTRCCHEEREHRWNKWVDMRDPNIKKIAGIPPKPFESFRDYLEYNWTIQLPAVHRGKTLHVIDPVPTIIEYLRKDEWDAFDVGDIQPSTISPSMEDTNTLSQYIWIQSRPKYFFDETADLHTLLSAYDDGADAVDAFAKKYLTKLYVETRNIACQPWESIMAAPAFILGIIENYAPALELVESKPWEYWRELREKTIRKSMEVDEVVPFAKRLVDISAEGLKKRGLGEEKYVLPLFDRIERRESPAQVAIREYTEKGIEKFISSRVISL